MLLAYASFDPIVCFLLLIGLGSWGLRKFFKQFDADGSVHAAARKGVVNLIGRWLK